MMSFFLKHHFRSFFLFIVICLYIPFTVADEIMPAQEVSNQKPRKLESVNKYNPDDMRARAQNPLSATFSVPIKIVFHGGANNGNAGVLTAQPIFPVSLGNNWNLINQLNLNFIHTDGDITGIPELPNPYPSGGQSATGLADLNLTSFFTPATPEQVIWGLGLSMTFPTDYDSRQLGSGKFSLGPAAMVLTQNESWTLGLQGSQIWSALGSAGRENVSQFQLKPIINYNLPDNWYLVSNMTIVADWLENSDQRWTVPIGGGLGKVFEIGSLPINTRLEGYYNVVTPEEGPTWSMNLSVQFIFPDINPL